MIKKEIGCGDVYIGVRKEIFSFVPCRICVLGQGSLDCIDTRKKFNLKMVYHDKPYANYNIKLEN